MAGTIDFGIIKPELGDAFGAGYRASQQERNALAQQQQQRQLADLQIQNALREQRLAGEEEAAYKTAGGDMQRLQAELMQRGLGKQAMAVGAQMTKQQADKIQMLKNSTELMRHTATQIMSNPTLDFALAATQRFGKLTGTDVSADIAELTKIGDNPEGLKQWGAGHALSADKLIPQFKQFSVPGVGVQTGTTDYMGKFTPGQTFAEQISPYQQEQLKISKGQLAVSQGNLANAQQRLAQETAGGGTLTPESLDVAANIYLQTGALPPGMGKASAEMRTRVMNRATELAGGASAAETAGNIVAGKQTTAGQAAAVKSFNTGVEGRAVRSFNTAIDHLDTMGKLADALQNNDVKAFNSVSQAFASQTGSAAPTNFDAAKAIVGGEVAKALTGANMALKDREEIRDSLQRANSPAQLKGVITTLQQLMGGQLTSLQTQYTSSTGRKDFDAKLSKRSKEVVQSLGGETKTPSADPALPSGFKLDK